MKIQILPIASLLIVALTGCGGGGSSSGEASVSVEPPSAVNSTPVVVAADPQPEASIEQEQQVDSVESTSELSAAVDFALESNLGVSVNIDISGLDSNQGYLSICTVTDELGPDYDDCFVRTALSDGVYVGELKLSTALDRVYSAIWFLDMFREPIVTQHELAGKEITLSL